ncbi:enoyl-CoA hydratase-related protein [Sporosarcina sp. ACRSL]|uniref:enoyl-CoA hydratase/isomerase family protein n=1 Tax=Sporosarcina sp. ACRSL TaxID=2918215 RepID=UPI001EF3E29E|nr:enoyl-CoA hydratase-related protein [Sporosarcina sp. ACRSL]MCG7344052.1 enoyl-CoA hydratase-related protein [Sporosarcina sp. ACRSL]
MKFVSLEVENHIGVVTLHREPINAITFDMYEEIRDTFTAINVMDDVRVVILRAEGRMFSPGGDVNEFKTLQDRFSEYIDTVKISIDSVYNCHVPVVGVIHGAALGSGMALAACCDILVASDDAVFGIPEIKVGIIGAGEFADLLVPRKVLNYMALTGNPITAQEIQQYGGIHKVVPREELMNAALEVVDELLQVGPIASRYFKEALHRNLDAQLLEKSTLEASYTEKYVGTADFTEAITAFLEKRKPEYKGK